MRTEEFEEVVAEALEGLPEEIQNSLENVAVLVQDWPSREQLRSNGITNRYGLLGLYEGHPSHGPRHGVRHGAPRPHLHLSEAS